MHALTLVRPAREHLPSYIDALQRGWAPGSRGPDSAREELEDIATDPDIFLHWMDDPHAEGPPVQLPDGSKVPRISSLRRWIWDGAVAGLIGLRWQPGTTALPAHCLGHIGYAVVPWRQRRGYATRALALMLPEARGVGLPYVELTTDPDNMASQRVIEANGGWLHERFTKPDAYGAGPGLRYRIALA